MHLFLHSLGWVCALQVLESGHTVILGWGDKALDIIRQLALANDRSFFPDIRKHGILMGIFASRRKRA